MRKFVLATAVVIATSAMPAVADEMIDPPADWTGPYVGGNAGIAILDGSARVTLPGSVTNFELDDTGFTFGGQIGYNWLHDDFVFGVEADINYLDVGDRGIVPLTTTGAFSLDSDWYATIRARGGMVMDKTLFYATAGLALMDADLRTQAIAAAAVAGSASDSDVLLGFAVGAGIEHSFSEKWSAKLEYLYMNFESDSLSAAFATARVNPDLHVIRAGINYHFCWDSRC